jgi:hypothetical protein
MVMTATLEATPIRERLRAALEGERHDEVILGRDWQQRAARAWLREVLGVDPDAVAVIEDDQFGDVYVVDGLELVFESEWWTVTKLWLVRTCTTCRQRFIPVGDACKSLADLARWADEPRPMHGPYDTCQAAA